MADHDRGIFRDKNRALRNVILGKLLIWISANTNNDLEWSLVQLFRLFELLTKNVSKKLHIPY